MLIGSFVFVALLIVALTINLSSTPPLWWDEGWTLSVARNWLELGHYGRLLNGQLVPRGLEAAFPVTASIALSFATFGVGIVQARLVAVVFTLATLLILYELARRFYGSVVGIATLVCLILLSGHADINPVIAGRQVMAEFPAMLFLLAGYLCLLLAERRPLLHMPLAIGFWTLALFTKAQVQPFWVCSLVVPLMLSLLRSEWRFVWLLGISLVCSAAAFLGLQYYWNSIMPSSSVSGLTQVIALVFFKHTRMGVVAETLRFGIPTLVGLCWAVWRFLSKGSKMESHVEMVHVSFLILAASWFMWYETLSLGWPRYFLPPALLSSMFVAAMLYQWTGKFSLAYTVERSTHLLKTFRVDQRSFTALFAVVLVAMSLGRTLTILYDAYVLKPDRSVMDTLRFLNTQTPANALIETYESELFFLLQRRYHYPPDQVHVDLIRRNSLGHRVNIDYDPVDTNPDYLVVGRQSKFWDFYDPYLETGAFRSIREKGRYEIFERVRQPNDTKFEHNRQ